VFWVQTQLVSVSSPFSTTTHRQHHSVWSFYVPLFGTLIVLGFLYWKRHSHPLNIALLSIFTLMEAFTLGVVTAFYDNVIVLQALLITTGVFLGLTLFTLQSKVIE
jgi:protein lifeguard